MSEWYVRDCSRKQKAQYQVRGRSGKPVTNTIPYGFKKDPEIKRHWLVDEEAAEVVRRIFRLSAEGMGPHMIAKVLMMDKVERPSYYLAQRGRGTCQSKTDMSRPYDWNGNTIRDILAKPEYMGHTVNFRAYKPSYKEKKMIKRPQSEWLIFLVWIKKMQGQKCRHVSTFGLFFATYLNYVQSLECYRPILSTVRIVVVFVDIAELENNHSIF
nr:recombinase family protein [uncultured Oscillibacter sp.]